MSPIASFTENIMVLIRADAGQATAATKGLATEAKRADTAFDGLGKQVGVTGSTIKGALVAGAAAFVGAGLVEGVQRLVTGFNEAAQAASTLSQVTNSSVGDSSRFLAVAENYGLGMNDIVEIFADLQQAVDQGKVDLDELGVTMTKNADGTTDWIATTEDLLEAINEIPDATKRMAVMFSAFGEEGAKQLIKMTTSGVSLKEQMDAIATTRVLGTDDILAAQEFNQAMTDLKGAAGGLAIELGRTLVPALQTMLDIVTPLIGFLAEFDGKTIMLAGSALLLAGNQGRVVAALEKMGGLVKGVGNRLLAPLITDFSGISIEADKSAKAIDRHTEAVKKTKAQTVAAAAPRLIFAAAAAWEVASQAVGAYNDDIKSVADSLGEVNAQTAETVLKQQSTWEKIGGAISDTFSWEGIKQNLSWGGPSKGDVVGSVEDDLNKAKEASDELTKAQGAYAVAADDAKEAQDDLNRMIAEGGHTQQELSDQVNITGEAMARQKAATDTARQALDAYNATHQEAVDATLAQIDLEWALEDAQKATAKAVKEKGSNSREVAEAALAEAEANAKLAEQTALLAGETFTAADSHDALLASLRESLDNPDLTKGERKSIQDLIDKIEHAQGVAGEGILIGDIRFKEGTTEEQVSKLTSQIDEALRTHNVGLASSLQAQLDSLKLPDSVTSGVQQIKVDIVDSAGNPLPDTKDVKVNVTTTGADSAKADLAGLGQPALYHIKYNTDVTNDDNTENVLKGLADPKIYHIEYNTDVTNDENTRNVLRGLAEPRKYTIEYNAVVTNAQNTRNVLDGLGRVRTSAIGGFLEPSAAARASGAPVVYNQTVSINVSGAGSPATTAREIDRYLRRAGDKTTVSVTA